MYDIINNCNTCSFAKKHLPKKVDRFGADRHCPDCKTLLIDEDTLKLKQKYCYRCGKKLDWGN